MSQSLLKRLLPGGYVQYLLKVYLLGMLAFSLFRIALFIFNQTSLTAVPDDNQISLILESLQIGFQFDTVISMYILALPLLLLFINNLVFNNKHRVITVVKWLVNIFYTIVLFISSADIPFFHHFNYRLNSAALMWTDSIDVAVSMIVQDPAYWGVLIPFIILIVGFYMLNQKFVIHLLKLNKSKNHWIKEVTLFILIGGVCFLALRGTTDFSRNPLNAKDAYFSNYSIINQASLNPVFTLIKSFEYQQKNSNAKLSLLDSDVAIKLVRNQFNRNYIDSISNAAAYAPDSQYIQPPNVVLVLMEGLSANKLAAFGDTNNCTPFLDTLINHSYFFKNAYCAGIHTHNGIFSSITALPAIFDRHALTQIPILRYNNLISSLKEQGYSTMYVSNHDVEFDNVGGFLVENGIEHFVSERDYDLSKKLSVWGVPDDYMFEFSIPYLNKLGAKENPFLSVYMTTSNHRPFRFPDYYTRRFENDEDEGTAFADWSIKKFISKAKEQPWFENTIFVFMSDHGWPINVKYDIPLSYVHVPLFFYSPKYFPKPIVDESLAAQLDLFPSIMSAVKVPYTNNTMGVDLFSESRPYVYFNADDKIGVRNKKYYYIYRKDGPESLYELPSVENIIESHQSLAKEMRDYAFSQMQVTFDAIQKNKVGKPTK